MADTLLRILMSAAAWRDYGARIGAATPVTLVVYEPARSQPVGMATAELAFLTRNLFAGGTRDRLSPDFLGFVEYLRSTSTLRWVHIFPAGADLWVYQEMLRRGVRVTTSAEATAPVVAQSAITRLLALARQLPRCAEAQRRHSWEPLHGPGQPRSLVGQTAVIVGTGSIGQEIGLLCQALRLCTVGVRHTPDRAPPPGFEEVLGYDHLHEALQRADWLILACPLTEVTRDIIDAQALACLPRGAWLINVARGPLVVEEALSDALSSGALGGAMLDVFREEPLPEYSPFWNLPNVIVTPQSAAASDGAAAAVTDIFIRNLLRWREGQSLLNEVVPTA